jgi:AraC-like DNA-binding protein
MDYRVSTVIALMEEQIHHKTSLCEMARRVQLSPSRLRHIFKVETALTLTQYLKSMRMREAKKIMEASCLAVKEVMIRVGLSDKSHFERDFKKAFGLTPAQYKTLCVHSHIVKHPEMEKDKHNGHQIVNSAIEFVLHSSTENSNLRADHTSAGDGEAIVHLNRSLERNLKMNNETMIEVTEPQQFDELFEELSVTELEDRLELVCRCCCRVSPD